MSEELILSPADELWHERRREVYTASDMGLLFGLPGFAGRTVSDVYFEKLYGLVKDKSTPSTRMGQKMEPLILDEAEQTLGRIVDRQLWIRDGQIGATLDGRCESDGRPVEAKTAGILWKPDEEWGESADDVPASVCLQVQTHLLLTNGDCGYVPAIIGGRGFILYEIPRSEGLLAEMRRKVAEFMESLKNRTAPAEPPQLSTLKRIRREPNKTAPRCAEVDEAKEIMAERKAAAKAETDAAELAQRTILAKMGDAEAIEVDGGIMTYYEQTNRYPPKPLATEATFRTLRFRKGG